MMKLSLLLDKTDFVPSSTDVEISGLALDSRKVKPGDLFFASRGTHLDGREFIEEALRRGASVVLAEASESLLKNNKILVVEDLKAKISEIAARFYGDPSKALQIIGITGTNGKTSCSHFIASALSQLNRPCGIIGTLGNGVYGNITPGTLTTPDPINLQKILADFRDQKIKTVAMEVSSHSIDQGRINGTRFDVGIFTNLTRDHLDYHGTMEAYGAAKKKFFDYPLLKQAVVNLDDAFGEKIASSLEGVKKVIGYSIDRQKKFSIPVVYADEIRLNASGIAANVFTPWGEGELRSKLIGRFNLSNLLAVLAALCLIDIPLAAALNCLSALTSVPGRMQTFGGKDGPLVVVDYAHTPDALEKVLAALKVTCEGKLHCVFGCGGDRDRGKRPLMAAIAERYADAVVVTDDNPRTEDPKQIVRDIIPGFAHPDKIIIEHDRSKAIRDVIQCASRGDCILIAGKGAETYQDIGGVKIPFSDVELVREIVNARLV